MKKLKVINPKAKGPQRYFKTPKEWVQYLHESLPETEKWIMEETEKRVKKP